MAFQNSGFGVDLWRFIAGIAVELVTIDTMCRSWYSISHRGRAYAYNQFFQFPAVPIVAFLAWPLIPHAPLGLDGWRWVVLIGSAGAIVIRFIRPALPESPRWLARRGRYCRRRNLGRGQPPIRCTRQRLRLHRTPSPGVKVRVQHWP
jgi:putative MFS transporter